MFDGLNRRMGGWVNGRWSRNKGAMDWDFCENMLENKETSMGRIIIY